MIVIDDDDMLVKLGCDRLVRGHCADGFPENEGEALDYVDLEPYDVISFPVGVARRFMNVTYDEPQKEHLLMFIIGGDQPQAEFTPKAVETKEERVNLVYAAKADLIRGWSEPLVPGQPAEVLVGGGQEATKKP